jgi:hypothetical protein
VQCAQYNGQCMCDGFHGLWLVCQWVHGGRILCMVAQQL